MAMKRGDARRPSATTGQRPRTQPRQATQATDLEAEGNATIGTGGDTTIQSANSAIGLHAEPSDRAVMRIGSGVPSPSSADIGASVGSLVALSVFAAIQANGGNNTRHVQVEVTPVATTEGAGRTITTQYGVRILPANNDPNATITNGIALEVSAPGVGTAKDIAAALLGKVGIGTNAPERELVVDDGGTGTHSVRVGQVDPLFLSGFYPSFAFNCYYDPGDSQNHYYTDGYAAQVYRDGSGHLKIQTAPSGVAGAVAVLTEALVILNNRHVGIGTVSPAGIFEVSDANPAVYISDTGTGYAQIAVRNGNATLYFGIDNAAGGALVAGSSPNAVVFNQANNYPIHFATNNTIRATITGAGALQVGGDISGGSLAGGNLTAGAYPIAGTAGKLQDGPTPLAGTKTYYVSDTSGGAVTRKLTFQDGILVSET